MGNLMMDLLDLAQIQKGTFRLNEQPFNLLDAIKNSFMIVKHIADKKDVELVPPNPD